MRTGWQTLARAVVFALLWLVLVGDFQRQELLVGAFAVAGAALFYAAVRRAQEHGFFYRWKDLRQVWRVPGNILLDALRVTNFLLRDVFAERTQSRLLVATFKPSHRGSDLDGREVLAVAYTTASPNSIVLGVHRKRNEILVHLLEPTPVSPSMRALGIGPEKQI
jgi:multisubunit Na+/H+ antiporter MnhE subunit